MKFLLSLLAITLGSTMLVGCASSSTPVGILYTQTDNGVSANNNVDSEKMGKSCSTSILSLLAIGETSVDSAKVDGNITKVATVDNSAFNVLGVYGRYCTVVYGE